MRDDNQALVSVIIPIYNAERFLEQCLESICGQTYENLEIICINDGSTDSSPEIIGRFAKEDPRIVAVDKANGGYGQGCNLGISMARGKWVSIIEPDDWIRPAMYGRMLDFASRFDEELDIVKTPWTQVFDWDDPERQKLRHSEMTGHIPTSEAPITLADAPLLIATHPSIWSAIYRKGFLAEKGIRFVEYPGAGWADNPFLIETMCQAGAIVYLDEEFYCYRADLKGSTRNHKTEDAVARPFNRWIDMTRIIERLGITDEGILKAHYLRGFRYVYGAFYDDGRDNPIVQEKTREVFDMMDPALVATMETVPLDRRRYFFELRGLPAPRMDRGRRMGYLFTRGRENIQIAGVKETFVAVANHFIRKVVR